MYRAPSCASDSHIVTVGAFGAGDTYSTNDPRLENFVGALTARRVKFSIRRGQVRFGLHAYNNEEDIDVIAGCAA